MKKIDDYLQIKEASELLGVTATTLRNWEKKGKLLSHRHPINKYRLYKREDLEALLQKIDTPQGQ
jgi:DNA (cytosine-5)-methyltransferase 1